MRLAVSEMGGVNSNAHGTKTGFSVRAATVASRAHVSSSFITLLTNATSALRYAAEAVRERELPLRRGA